MNTIEHRLLTQPIIVEAQNLSKLSDGPLRNKLSLSCQAYLQNNYDLYLQPLTPWEKVARALYHVAVSLLIAPLFFPAFRESFRLSLQYKVVLMPPVAIAAQQLQAAAEKNPDVVVKVVETKPVIIQENLALTENEEEEEEETTIDPYSQAMLVAYETIEWGLEKMKHVFNTLRPKRD